MMKHTGAVRAVGLALMLAVLWAAIAAANGGNTVLLPVIGYDPLPTLPPTPPPAAYSEAAVLYVTPRSQLNASTYNSGAFALDNQSLKGERIIEARIDLSTAVFMDMVFDPEGKAGDFIAKDVVVDGRVGLSYLGRSYEGPHDGGYDVLVLNFANFDPGERFLFSVDVDPTTIKGAQAPGPAESGSVCGLELIGSTVTVTFDNGKTQTNDLSWLPTPQFMSCGAWAQLRDGTPAEPMTTILGVTPPTVVFDPSQVVRVNGAPGQPVVVTIIEGGQYLAGLPNGGHDVDPFEANSAITVREYQARIGPGGLVDVPVQLTQSNSEGGYNLLTAAADDYYGRRGLLAAVKVLKLEVLPAK